MALSLSRWDPRHISAKSYRDIDAITVSSQVDVTKVSSESEENLKWM